MSALAYVFPPLSGFLVFLWGRDRRARFHGLQGVVLGVVWPALIYGATALTPGATQAVALAGGLAWLILIGSTALGRDPKIPLLGPALARWTGPATDEP